MARQRPSQQIAPAGQVRPHSPQCPDSVLRSVHLTFTAGLAGRTVAAAAAAGAGAGPVPANALPADAGGAGRAVPAATPAVARVAGGANAASRADDVAVGAHAAPPAAASAAYEGLAAAAVPARRPAVRADADLALAAPPAGGLLRTAAVLAALVAALGLDLSSRCPRGSRDQPRDRRPRRGRSADQLAADEHAPGGPGDLRKVPRLRAFRAIGNQRPDRLRPGSRPALHPALGTDQQRTRRGLDAIGVGDLAAVLQEHVAAPMRSRRRREAARRRARPPLSSAVRQHAATRRSRVQGRCRAHNPGRRRRGAVAGRPPGAR